MGNETSIMTETPRIGSVVSNGKRLWVVRSVCPPCKSMGCYAVDFIKYKSKPGYKGVVVYKSFKYDKVKLVATPPGITF